jgi:hypothetical protein
MRLFMHRRIISGIALVAFLFGFAFPALAVARQALDPVAFATICRIDADAAGDSGPTGSFQSKLKSAHCLMCVGSATPPSVSTVAPVVVAVVAPLIVVVLPGSSDAADDFAALQPLNPRAPPRS